MKQPPRFRYTPIVERQTISRPQRITQQIQPPRLVRRRPAAAGFNVNKRLPNAAQKRHRPVLFAGARCGGEALDDAVGFVRELKRQPGKDICLMGGGELARPLFEAGLIDEIGFNVHPVLLGSGIPAFHPMTRQIDLELKECKPFKNGCVHVTYRIRR